MKVNIGPYRSYRLSTHDLYSWYFFKRHKKYYFEVDEDQYDRLDKLVADATDYIQIALDHTINKVADKFGQRNIKVKVDPYDVWSADHTLALIIHPVLLELKKQKHSFPVVDPDDAPLIGVGEKDPNDEYTDSKSGERWEYVLDEMIWAFHQVIDDEATDQFYSGHSDIVWDKVKVNGQTLYEMKEGPNHTHKFDKEGWEKWNARKQNGFRLFGKYYESLWD